MEQRDRVCSLASGYHELTGSFASFMAVVRRIVKSCEAFGIKEGPSDNTFVGFGHEIRFSWFFLIHPTNGFGRLSVSLTGVTTPFYEIYFRGKLPVFLKGVDQQTPDFWGNQIASVEDLLFEIVDAFLDQDCFKP